jgi:hypothetical protein
MSDIAKLIAADRSVALIADDAAARDLEQCEAFWAGPAPAAEEAEESTEPLSDEELRRRLAVERIDPEMPADLRALVARRPVWPRYAVGGALAAGIAGLAIALASWQNQAPSPVSVAGNDMPAERRFDPDLVFLNPERGSSRKTSLEAAPPAQGEHHNASQETVGLPESDLTRAETFEMQRLLDELGYGPLARDGLFSDELGAALLRFRADRGMDAAEVNLRDTLVTLRYAARLEAMGEKDPVIERSEGD